MARGPSRKVEALVALFTPPACREEVVGDLYERFRSPRQYAFDALITVPLVILSRIRRTADPQVLVMHAFALYLSFLCAAWMSDPALVSSRFGLLRLAIPAGIAILGLVLEDVYSRPGRRSALSLTRGPAIGLGLALLSQGMFRAGNLEVALPGWIAVYGCGMSLLLSSALRLLFPPAANQLQSAHAPALWLKQAGEVDLTGSVRVLKAIAVIVAVAAIGMWAADHSAVPWDGYLMLVVALGFVYRITHRR
jgi:hypothetical protein